MTKDEENMLKFVRRLERVFGWWYDEEDTSLDDLIGNEEPGEYQYMARKLRKHLEATLLHE
ncbi:MAG: hypothetical protein FKY71_09925 [Spiribacter salinus]|uniref:Uncharacterized protein n=1 Tax=Spiribacter salinus TaxID=1335746 RepID=A0A540VR02_9GAMM|nr:MAG: hypothetical protein FKY71_09925 [Spiribacter salinus]